MLLFEDYIKQPTVGAVHMVSGNSGQRRLTRYDAKNAKTPFQYDRNAFAGIRPDQMPRFLSALTDQDDLPTREMRFDQLSALQNRVDPQKVNEIARSGRFKKRPVVVRNGQINLIADGHHRAAAAWILGSNSIRVAYKDITRFSNTMKGVYVAGDVPDWQSPLDVRKFDEDRRQVFGWASVVEKDGKLIIDKQGDQIEPAVLEAAAYEYVLSSRAQTDMHERHGVGRLIESTVFTAEKQKVMGIDLGQVGWWVGFQIDDDALWAAHKRGERPEFSIGGKAASVEV